MVRRAAVFAPPTRKQCQRDRKAVALRSRRVNRCIGCGGCPPVDPRPAAVDRVRHQVALSRAHVDGTRSVATVLVTEP
jgi:hypothetical protein